MDINISDTKEQRKFGIVMAVAITILGLIRWWLHDFGPLPVYFFYVAGAFAALGLIAPIVLKPVFYLWLKFGLGMNWFMTRLLLMIAWWLMIVPTRFILKLRGMDPLKRAWLPDADTYWEDAEEQPTDPQRYQNQF